MPTSGQRVCGGWGPEGCWAQNLEKVGAPKGGSSERWGPEEERAMMRSTYIRLGPSCPSSRTPHHGECLLAGRWTRRWGLSLRQEAAGGGRQWQAGGDGAVAAWRGWLRLVLRFVLFFDVVVDVPVVQVVDLGLSSSWTRLSCPFLCRTGVLVQTVQPVEFRSCSSWPRC